MVHSFQRHRRRLGVSERSQGSGSEFSHSRLGLVEERYHPRYFPLLRDWSADRLGRILERGDRRGVCEMGQRYGVGAWDRRLHRQGDRGWRLSQNRARRRGHVALRHYVQPPTLAPALRPRRKALAALLSGFYAQQTL